MYSMSYLFFQKRHKSRFISENVLFNQSD